MSIRAALLAEVEAFLELSGMTPSRLGKEAINDPSWYFRFQRGMDTKIETADRLRSYMDHWRRTIGQRRAQLMTDQQQVGAE